MLYLKIYYLIQKYSIIFVAIVKIHKFELNYSVTFKIMV